MLLQSQQFLKLFSSSWSKASTFIDTSLLQHFDSKSHFLPELNGSVKGLLFKGNLEYFLKFIG